MEFAVHNDCDAFVSRYRCPQRLICSRERAGQSLTWEYKRHIREHTGTNRIKWQYVGVIIANGPKISYEELFGECSGKLPCTLHKVHCEKKGARKERLLRGKPGGMLAASK